MSKKYFDPVTPSVNFPKIEESILEFWDKNKIFEKSVEKNKNSKPFIFYEGPPTANGKPGIHHVESRSFKDIFPRYKTMRGFYTERKGGWDCHGLPVELEVEKKLGISGKPQIEAYGIEEFNKLCKASVFEYVKEWEKVTKRLGYWVDLENAYETMDNKFIETEWGLLKNIWDKGWLYEDYKVVPYCPRCGTSLSSHELSLGYKDDIEDPSVFIKFKIKNDDTYFLAWTTTPWTLPGNVALAVDEKKNYVKVSTAKGKLILSEKRFTDLNIDGEVVEKFTGKELLNIEYEPLFDFIKYDQKSHFIVPADFVSMDEGTGIVHTAVMYGEDDFQLGKKYNLPTKHSVNEKGEFVSEVTPWAGRFVKNKTLESEIIETLEKNGNLLKAETIKHTYPFCWRCNTPLLYYAMTSWYLKTTAVKDELVKNNNSVNWYPEHIKEGRMGEWLRNNRDWALSRSRYWGTPLPIWRCNSCNHTTLIGSIQELSELAKKDLSSLDLHRPFVDEIKFSCNHCQSGEMSRVNFVLDCWFDSGAMPFASNTQGFPADYISEAIDQTRGWFYTLQAVSALLNKNTAYKNVICLGHILDEKGNKMSKSKGNVVSPWDIFNDVGADAARWYFYSATSPGPSFRFSNNLVKDVTKRFLLILWNSYNYFVTYANLNDWQPNQNSKTETENLNILDKWILIRLQDLTNKTTDFLDSYNLYDATREIEGFVSSDFSQWYIRRSRGRDDSNFFQISYQVLTTVSKIIAPFIPFISDEIYQNLTKEESVHLASWPENQALSINESKILEDMKEVRKIIESGHALRQKSNISLRQPLSLLQVPNPKFSIPNYRSLIQDELNVKDVCEGDQLELDTTLTPDLIAEGEYRDFIRSVQVLRKTQGFEVRDKINIIAPNWPKSFETEILHKTLAVSITKGDTLTITKV